MRVLALLQGMERQDKHATKAMYDESTGAPPALAQVSAAQITPSTHVSTYTSDHNCRSPASTPRCRSTRDANGPVWREWELKEKVWVQNLPWDSSLRVSRVMHTLTSPHHLNRGFVHRCLFLLITMTRLMAAIAADERLKSTQSLCLAPEEARAKFAICSVQLHFSVFTQRAL